MSKSSPAICDSSSFSLIFVCSVMGSVGLFFSAFADFCTPSVQRQIPLLQKIEQEMQEEKERYEWLNGKNGAHK